MSETGTPGNKPTEFDDRVPARRSTLRLVLSILVALAAALALYVLQPGWFSVPSVGAPKPAATSVPSPTPKPKPVAVPRLGESQRVDNVAVTPLDVTYTRGNGSVVANQGDVFAVIMMQFVNHSGHDITFVPNVNCTIPYCNFYVSDSQGEKNPPIPFDPFHTRLRAVVLQDGGRQQGTYTFEVPERDVRDHALQLLYYHDPVLDANSVRHWLLEKAPKHG